MSKHTEAPWSAGKKSVLTELTRGSHTILIESDGYIVAHVSSWRSDPKTASEAFANAKLIAAAPEMLADLREAAALLRKYEQLHRAKDTEESTGKAEVNAGWAARFENTIAKAEGQSK